MLLLSLVTSIGSSVLGASSASAATPTDQASCQAQGWTWVNNDHIHGVCQPPQVACAAGSNYVPKNTPDYCSPDGEVASYGDYTLIGKCIHNEMKSSFDVQLGLNGQAPPNTWFNSNDTYGYVYPGAMKLNCWDAVSAAMQLWGYGSDYKSFLNDIGYHFNENANSGNLPNWSGPSDDGTRQANFQNAIKNRVYGGQAPNLSGAAKYAQAWDAFIRQGGPCQATPLGVFDQMTNPELKAAVSNNKTVTGQGVVVPNFNGAISSNGLYQYTKVTNVAVTNDTSGNATAANAEVWGYVYHASTSSTIYSEYNATSFDSPVTAILYGYHEYHTLFEDWYPTRENCSSLVSDINNNAAAMLKWKSDNLAHLGAGQTTQKCSDGSTADPTKGCPAGDGSKSKPACAIDGVGWIVCSVGNFVAKLVDGMYTLVVAHLLEEPPVDLNGGEHNVWTAFQNIANVVFVIFFMMIVYAQMTGAGLSNLSVKKMLPRLIVAAVLVNTSFYLCALAVDVSNVLGASIHSLLAGIRGSSNLPGPSAWASITAFLLAGGAVAGSVALTGGAAIALVALATPEIGLALLGILLPLLLGAVLAVFILVFILIARHALLFMLIVLSPLAFVAYILPNTSNWFTKWRQWFISLLVLYPVVSFMFGASEIAGMLMISSAQGGVLDAVGGAIAIMSGLFMLVAPFFFLPFMIRRFGGANLDQLASSVSNKIRGATMPLANLGRKAGKVGLGREWERRKAGVTPNIRGYSHLARFRRGANALAGDAAIAWSQRGARRKMELDHYGREQEHAVMERLGSDEAYRLAAAGGDAKAAELLQARAAFHADKMWDEEVGRQQKSMSSMHPSDLLKIVKDTGISHERRAAAAGMIMKNGSMGDIHQLFDASQGLTDGAASGIRKQMMGDMNRTPFGLGSGDIASMKRGEAATHEVDDGNGGKKTVASSYADRLNSRAQNKLSDAAWASMDPDDQAALVAQAKDGGLSAESLQNLVNATSEAESNPNISVKDDAKGLGAELRAHAQKQGITPASAATAPATSATPAADSGSGPSLRGGETTTDSGLIVPRDMR